MRRKYDHDKSVHRRFIADHFHPQRGDDWAELEQAANARGRVRGFAEIKVNGIASPENVEYVRAVAKAFGLRFGPGVSKRVQRKLRLEEPRTKADLKRELKRNSKPLRERAWDEMQKLIDAKVTEEGGNNHGPMVENIIRANGGVPGEPWCGDTVAYCYLKAGAKSVVRAWASVSFLNRLLSLVLKPKRGHVVTYTFDHTGLFKCWAPEHGDGYFWAGEGNTGNTGAASDSVTGGDGVKLKLRHKSLVAAFRRVSN